MFWKNAYIFSKNVGAKHVNRVEANTFLQEIVGAACKSIHIVLRIRKILPILLRNFASHPHKNDVKWRVHWRKIFVAPKLASTTRFSIYLYYVVMLSFQASLNIFLDAIYNTRRWQKISHFMTCFLQGID